MTARTSSRSLQVLAEQAKGCRNCDLWEPATQTVFGEGPADAAVVMVGEQPGDREDLAGRPFVGPAGRLLDKALIEAGLDRESIYVTNAVKHFKWSPRGKRRIHQRPNVGEMMACRPWLEGELDAVSPDVVVVLGAVALRSVLGPGRTVSGLRGRVLEEGPAPATVVTIHPSALLRVDDSDRREAETAAFVDDLRLAAAAVR